MKKLLSFIAILYLTHQNASCQRISNDDTTLRVIIIEADKNVVLPTLKDPGVFCTDLQRAWDTYLKIHKDELDFTFSDSNHYYFSMTFEIQADGKSLKHKQTISYSKNHLAVREALGATLLRSRRTAAYKIAGNRKKFFPVLATAYFTIAAGGIKNVRFVNSRTSEPFYECSIPFDADSDKNGPFTRN